MAMTTGIFSCESGTDESNEIFANINGPAIIYPFIREYMANLAMKGGITLFLPPVNFIKMHLDEKAKNSSQ
jgi:preprotein translocase subunit SecB